MQLIMSKSKAIKLTGGLTKVSKLNCKSYSIPAQTCKIGKKLRKIEGTVCSICYALKGNYTRFPNVKTSLYKRYRTLKNKHWVSAITFLLKKETYFRWHDSGDIQSIEHLKNIFKVAENTPNCKHWLPTREYNTVKQYIASGLKVPENVTIRLSSLYINGVPPEKIAMECKVQTSGVDNSGFQCIAPLQGGKCLDCRACWSKDIQNISYKRH